jgi:hypothetical protein
MTRSQANLIEIPELVHCVDWFLPLWEPAPNTMNEYVLYQEISPPVFGSIIYGTGFDPYPVEDVPC